MRSLTYIEAQNFLSLGKVRVDLGALNVLVGPNGAGKTNLLRTVEFLGETARTDLVPAVNYFGGFNVLFFRGDLGKRPRRIRLAIGAQITPYASTNAPDEYALTFWEHSDKLLTGPVKILQRNETFTFKRTSGQGRRIIIKGSHVDIIDDPEAKQPTRLSLAAASSGLSTLRRLGKQYGAEQIDELAILLESFRVFEPNVAKSRQPHRMIAGEPVHLAPDASNLAAYVAWLATAEPDVFEALADDLRCIVPGLTALRLVPLGGSSPGVSIDIEEQGLRGTTPLGSASFGTIRALALLAMLHDPAPPRLTCVEEVDHGLHPNALDRIVERLREASTRTQILAATHSPALVNRLHPEELIVCERDPTTGASRIPAIDPALVRTMYREEELRLGELWFSGALGGVIPPLRAMPA
jgi:predicted ATPase